MRKPIRTAFRPTVESFEARIAASSGLGAPAHAVHAASAKHHAASKHGHHADHKIEHPAPAPGPSAPVAAPTYPPAPRPASLPSTGASNQAWVKLVNMTGQDLQYQISLGPYQGGKFLPFDIAGFGADSVQYRAAGLVANGHRESPSFAIRFDNGPVIPLNTGISAQGARSYYIFLDGNGQYYVAPFTDATAAR
jgi:hypothetical protein